MNNNVIWFYEIGGIMKTITKLTLVISFSLSILFLTNSCGLLMHASHKSKRKDWESRRAERRKRWDRRRAERRKRWERKRAERDKEWARSVKAHNKAFNAIKHVFKTRDCTKKDIIIKNPVKLKLVRSNAKKGTISSVRHKGKTLFRLVLGRKQKRAVFLINRKNRTLLKAMPVLSKGEFKVIFTNTRGRKGRLKLKMAHNAGKVFYQLKLRHFKNGFSLKLYHVFSPFRNVRHYVLQYKNKTVFVGRFGVELEGQSAKVSASVLVDKHFLSRNLRQVGQWIAITSVLQELYLLGQPGASTLVSNQAFRNHFRIHNQHVQNHQRIHNQHIRNSQKMHNQHMRTHQNMHKQHMRTHNQHMKMHGQ